MKYYRNGNEISEQDARDSNGILKDGVSARIGMQMRDSDLQRAVAADAANRRPVYDAFGHPAGYRPGLVFTNDQAARDAKAAAYQQYDQDIGRAWQQTNPRGKSEAVTGVGSNGPREQEWQACPDCNGHDADCATRGGRGYISRDDADTDAALEAAFQQTQTGGRRLDAMMRDHQSNMRHVYDAYDRDLTQSWRHS